jgi:hypothetical protein
VLQNAVKLKPRENAGVADWRTDAKEEDGPWELVASPAPKKAAAIEVDSSSSDSVSSGDNDILKRLLQRREAEENK